MIRHWIQANDGNKKNKKKKYSSERKSLQRMSNAFKSQTVSDTKDMRIGVAAVS